MSGISGCNLKIPDKPFDACSPGPARESDITIEQNNPRELKVTKVIYNYKAKTEKQIKESIQLEIDTFLRDWSSYKFVNSKSHFNGMGGLEMVLYFELKQQS
jgi:hypothetical protein